MIEHCEDEVPANRKERRRLVAGVRAGPAKFGEQPLLVTVAVIVLITITEAHIGVGSRCSGTGNSFSKFSIRKWSSKSGLCGGDPRHVSRLKKQFSL